MITEIKEIFRSLAINQYKIFMYTVRQIREDYTRAGLQQDIRKEIVYYVLFFSMGTRIFRIELAGNRHPGLRNTIRQLMDKREWYCESEDGSFFNDKLTDLSSPSGEQLDTARISDLFSGDLNIVQAQYVRTVCSLDFYTAGDHCRQTSVSSSLQALAEIMPGFPARELIVQDPVNMQDVLAELRQQKERMLKNIADSSLPAVEYTGSECVISPEISEMLLSFLCSVLRGDSILAGTSFLSAEDFHKPLFSNSLSVFRDHGLSGIASEHITGERKYYIRNGVLESAFNDLKIASYLNQPDGDAFFDPDELKTLISIRNVRIDPAVSAAPDVPVFDSIIGTRFFFNPMTGKLDMLLRSPSGYSRRIQGSIIQLFNCVKGAVMPDGASDPEAFGLLVDFR